jgi:hypothetical protein
LSEFLLYTDSGTYQGSELFPKRLLMSNDDQFESIMSSQDIRRPSPVDVTAPGLQPVEKDDISAEASDKSSPGPSVRLKAFE